MLPQPGFLERLRELATKHGTVLVFDEVITGFRHGLGGYQAIAGVTPDLTTLGKAMANGWPVSALGGKAELMELFSTDARAAGVLRRHVQRASGHDRGGARDDREARARARARARLPARRARARRSCRRSTTGSASRPSSPGSARSSSRYFLEGPVVSYDDLLRNDVDLFVGYRRELMKDGIFELPLNLKRSHFSYAHTDDDVDRLLEATEARRRAPSAGDARVTASRGLLHDRPRPHRASRSAASRFPRITNTGRLGEHASSTIASIANGEGPTVLVLAGNHGDEYEGQVAALRLLQELQPEQVSGA